MEGPMQRNNSHDEGSNPFCGVGYWFVDSKDPALMGQVYSTFIFQLSFATTATTIVSGAMAERTHLRAYIIFSLLNTVIYCIPAHWVWADNGFLKSLGVIDIAGSGVVHLLGAGSALVAAWILGPRIGRYDEDSQIKQIGNGTNTMIGLFMLWWGWLAFNSGSTFGISGGKWILAARTSVITLNGSMGGGVVGVIYTFIRNKGRFLIPDLVNAVLGSLVSVTATCALIQPWEAVVVGAVGGLLSCLAPSLLDKLKIDDPVCAVAIHGFGGFWGMLAAGLFVDIDPIEHMGGNNRGVFHGGGFRLLGVQLLACVCILAWSMVLTLVMLLLINKTIGLRLSPEQEAMGSDFVEHCIGIAPHELHLQDCTVKELLSLHIKNKGNTFGGRRKSIFTASYKAQKHYKENGESSNDITNTITDQSRASGVLNGHLTSIREVNTGNIDGITADHGVINPSFDEDIVTSL